MKCVDFKLSISDVLLEHRAQLSVACEDQILPLFYGPALRICRTVRENQGKITGSEGRIW